MKNNHFHCTRSERKGKDGIQVIEDNPYSIPLKRKDGACMNYEFYVNGEKRMPTKEESQKLLDKMMQPLGYRRRNQPSCASKEVQKEAVSL